MKRITLFLLAALVASPVFAQLELPALSPKSTLHQQFSTSSIEISYSRPSVRDRKIFGELVPYNTLWRTGANAATTVKFGQDVMVAGKELKAGTYELFTVPGKDRWEIIFNRGKDDWGAYAVDQEKTALSFMANVDKLNRSVETFTIQISDITLHTCRIDLLWEDVKVSIPVRVDNEKELLSQIDQAINQPNIPYYQAASYYYYSGQNLKKAMGWVEKALTQNPNAFYMWHLKAKIAHKLGNTNEAIEAAKRSIETAKGTGAEKEYQRNNEKLIREIRKG